MEDVRDKVVNELSQLLKKEEQTQNNRWLNNQAGNKQARNEGVAIHPIKVVKKRFGYADYPVVVFQFFHPINFQLFREGAPVVIYGSEKEVINGKLGFIEGRNGEVVLFHPDFPEWIDETDVGIRLVPDTRSFSIMQSVLKKIRTNENKQLTQLFDLVHKGREIETSIIHQELNFFNPSLNESQKTAVKNLVGDAPVHLLHGPPGTGKTTTLVETVLQVNQREEKVLVTAPSHAAIDHFATKLIENNCKILRIGNTSKINKKLWTFTPEGILSSSENAKKLKKLRIQAAEYRKLAKQYKRSFGKAEREQRNELFKLAKSLQNEIKYTSNAILEKAALEADVILGTPIGLMDSLVKKLTFETVIIDESAQCLEPMAWVAAQLGEKLVLAGDPFQLPPTVIDEDAAKNGLAKSILENAFEAALPKHFLNLQYRMPPMIADFSSHYFYDNKLHSFKDNKANAEHLIFIDSAGADFNESTQEEGLSKENKFELDFIAEHLKKWTKNRENVVFISPYAAQIRLAKEKLPIKCSTIDAFQGQEAEIIIISLVRSNNEGKIGFLSDYRRMNVAMTRAQEKLIVVGDSATLCKDPFYTSFLAYVENINAYRSVFEFMY